jgi:hypothetical protein
LILCIGIIQMYLLSCPWIWQLSRDVLLDAGFVCSKAAMTGETTEWTLHDLHHLRILGLLRHAMDITMQNSFIISEMFFSFSFGGYFRILFGTLSKLLVSKCYFQFLLQCAISYVICAICICHVICGLLGD